MTTDAPESRPPEIWAVAIHLTRTVLPTLILLHAPTGEPQQQARLLNVILPATDERTAIETVLRYLAESPLGQEGWAADLVTAGQVSEVALGMAGYARTGANV